MNSTSLTAATTSTTTFQDNGQIKQTAVRSVRPGTGVPPLPLTDVASFLGKPVIVASGTIGTGDTYNATIATGSISTLLAAQTIWTQKLSGYKLIRATANIKVVINSNPFQQGKLILTFLPVYRHLNASEQGMRNNTLSQVTTQPNVELDLRDSSCEMSIPYITPSHYYDRETALYDWGTYFLKVHTPLRTGSAGETSYPYTVFLHFSDVELAAPQYGPESGIRAPKKAIRLSQSSTLRREERDIAEDGAVASVASKIADASFSVRNSYFGSIPGVGATMDILGGVTSAVGAVASIFGWSKPLKNDTPMPVVQQFYKHLHNDTGANLADNLALGISSTLPVDSKYFGTDIDEMSFAYLKQIPALYTLATWTTANAAGTSIYDVDLTPYSFLASDIKVSGLYGTRYYTGQPAFIMSRMFQQYRGGFEITLKFVKTMFHTGRLSVTFEPNGNNTTLAQAPFVLREVIDLSTTSEITLKIPYLFGTDFLSTGAGNVDDFMSTSLGNLRVFVLTPLRAPETVSDTVDIWAYSRPADDFELAIPVPHNMWPFTAESGLEALVPDAMVNKGIGNAGDPQIDITPQMACVCDPLVSVKQLLNSSRTLYTTGADFNANLQRIAPFASIVIKGANFVTYPLPNGGLGGDYINFFSSAYAFSRGGVRLSFIGTGTTIANGGYNTYTLTPTTTADNGLMPYDTNQSYTSNAGITTAAKKRMAIVAYRPNSAGVGDVVVPHFLPTPIRINRFQSNTNPSVFPTGAKLPDMPRMSVTCFGSETIQLLRSGADDYALGYFIGFPPIAWDKFLI